MKILADECCAAGLVERLRQDGHDVLYVAEAMRGRTDDEVLRRAFAEQRLLLTEDKDFGELIYRLRRPARGIVLLRFAEEEQDLKVHRLRELLAGPVNRLQSSFVVLEPDKTRLRPLQ